MKSEYQRLLAVDRFKHITAGVSHDLEHIANLISQICETPVALVSIIDETTQWFKATKGLAIECNDRETSFCNTTIQQSDVFIIPDTLQDERYKDFPVVVQEPHVRFYAGIALNTYDGQSVGSICVLDVVPRQLNDKQKDALRILAKQVVNIFELNWSLRAMAEQYETLQKQAMTAEREKMQFSAVVNSSDNIHILLSKTFEVQIFNKAAAMHIFHYYGMLLEAGTSILSYVNSTSAKRLLIYFNNALTGVSHRTEWKFELNHEPRWLDITFTAAKNDDDVVIGIAINATDITWLKKEIEASSKPQTAV